MPNHVSNRITIHAEPERVQEILEAIKYDDYKIGSIDFNKIIPMPPELDVESGSYSSRALEFYTQYIKQENEPGIQAKLVKEYSADQKLIDHVNKKVNKLGQFFDGIIGAEVFLRLENVQDDENKIAEVKLLIPGNDLFVKKQSKTFEEAVNKAVETLNRQVTKYKEKLKGK